jgi:DNA-binding IclR family transcriptional regulator
MLACYPQKEAMALVDKSAGSHLDHALTDRGKLSKEIETARRRHIAFDLGEHDPGIGAIGVAVLDSFGRPIAVSIPVPWSRFAQRRKDLPETLLRFRQEMRAVVAGSANYRGKQR